MPFTISHAAAALPVHAVARALPLAALIIGSMAPDFPYFFAIDRETLDAHSLPGLFLVALPAGMAVWLFFVTLLERPTIAFLPDAWRTRMTPTTLNPRGGLLAALAVLLGAFTHVAWDALTHSSQPLALSIPGIHDSYFDFSGTRIPVYYLLQVMSSGLGLLVLALWAWSIRKRTPAPADGVVPALTPKVRTSERWLALLFIGATACAPPLFAILYYGYGQLARSDLLFVVLVGGEAGCFVAWSILAIAARFRARALRRLAPTNLG